VRERERNHEGAAEDRKFIQGSSSWRFEMKKKRTIQVFIFEKIDGMPSFLCVNLSVAANFSFSLPAG